MQYTKKAFKYSIIYFFAITLFCLVNRSVADSSNLDTLQLAQVLFRHGDRTPEYAYPTDPYQDESNWPQGWGQLTEIGKMQEYELGLYLRSRYETYLTEKYISDEIYVLSSDTDRAIMSAELCLAGLFPANKNVTNWSPDINWQPVPLHTIAAESDNIIRMKKVCPKFDEIFNDFIHNSEAMRKINSDNAELFKSLSDNSGVNITTFMDIDDFYATLKVEQIQNLTLPDWTKPLFTDENFQYLYNFSFAAKTLTKDLQRLRVGELVKLLASNINKTISGYNDTTEWKTKFVLLSGHDVTLVDLMNTLGVYNMKVPYYGSALMMELHQQLNSTNGENYYFNIFLKNDTTKDAYKLTLPGCDFNCPLETFFEMIYPIIPINWDEECQRLSQLEKYSWIAVFAIGIAVTVLGGIIIGTALILCKRIRQNNEMRRGYQQY